jgi:uncharacterized protein YbcC (UPF0753/DUF2309 family)
MTQPEYLHSECATIVIVAGHGTKNTNNGHGHTGDAIPN